MGIIIHICENISGVTVAICNTINHILQICIVSDFLQIWIVYDSINTVCAFFICNLVDQEP